jgi:hypothetical protein
MIGFRGGTWDLRRIPKLGSRDITAMRLASIIAMFGRTFTNVTSGGCEVESTGPLNTLNHEIKTIVVLLGK